MDPIMVNVYYLLNGEQKTIRNTYLAQACVSARTIIQAGGEITGIINVEDDQ